MGQTLIYYRYHTVFSTKHRRPLLTQEIMPQLIKVIEGSSATATGLCWP